VDVLACYVQKAYINAATKEKICFCGGNEMGSNKFNVIVIVHALYGLRGCISCLADPNLWLRVATKPDGSKIYEYVLHFVDNCIFQGLDPKGFMDYLRTVCIPNDGAVKEPETYLDTDVWIHELVDVQKAWVISLDT
jgi:hypothetical protein